LWDRMRRGFTMPNLEGELVADREQWYASRPDYIQRMTERSSKYLFHIVEELERRNMPTELALLPFIESAFNPQAVSSAKAAGMWQFMPATGRYFDLKQNAFRDDRRDVLASTRAALDYLQKLHRMFDDWHLALAAYNWGEGSVGRAIARNKREGLGTSYTDLRMPDETRLYVPKLQAVKNIVANPQAFRTELPVIENHPYFQQVQITRDIDVALAARLADVELANFKALNPSAHRPVILATGNPHILLPWDNAKVFQRNFEAYTQGQFASWTAWTVPATLSVGSCRAPQKRTTMWPALWPRTPS
jgi:membrane-bound lytic murein transglycosylase D